MFGKLDHSSNSSRHFVRPRNIFLDKIEMKNPFVEELQQERPVPVAQ